MLVKIPADISLSYNEIKYSLRLKSRQIFCDSRAKYSTYALKLISSCLIIAVSNDHDILDDDVILE